MKGLTLVELIIVLAIIGTLIMLGIPTYAKFYSFIQLWGDERRMTSYLREFQQKSISDHNNYKFTFIDNKTYTIEKSNNGGWDPEKTVEVQKEVIIQSAPSTIIFHPLGNADLVGGGTIVFENIEGETSAITVNAITGHIAIQ